MARKLPIAIALLVLIAALFAGSAQARRLSTLVAPPSACPHQSDLGDSPAVQERAMLCMTDFARDHDGLGTLSNAADLARSAGKKSGDIIRCDSFSHEACGHQFTFWMHRTGYLAARCWRAGENIAWGTGGQASVRSIFVAWLHSPEHRANLLGRYSSTGIGLRIGNLDGHHGAHIWTQDFGSHCGATPSRQHGTPHVPKPRLGLRLAFRAH